MDMDNNYVGQGSSDKLDEEIAARIIDDAKKRPINTKHKLNVVTDFSSSQQDASNNTPTNVNLTDNSKAAHPVKGRDSRKQ